MMNQTNRAQDPQPDEKQPSPSPTAQEETTPPSEELTEDAEVEEKEETEEMEMNGGKGPHGKTWPKVCVGT